LLFGSYPLRLGTDATVGGTVTRLLFMQSKGDAASHGTSAPCMTGNVDDGLLVINHGAPTTQTRETLLNALAASMGRERLRWDAAFDSACGRKTKAPGRPGLWMERIPL
jgi:hypothetical protein